MSSAENKTLSELYRLNMDIIKRRSNGKVLWQPRISCWYLDKQFCKSELPGRYKGADLIGLYERLGCSDRLYDYFNPCIETHIDESVSFEIVPITDGATDRDFKRIIKTPVGTVTELVRGNESNYGMMPYKWLITDADELKVLCYLEEATTYSFNMDTYNESFKKVSHLGIPTVFLPRTNIQKLLIELCGVEGTYYMLADYPDKVEHYFKVLSKSQEGLLKVIADCPVESINYGDNLHCKILPDYLFRQYILPEYEKRGDILHRAGKFIFSHWDGDCRDYLKYAKTCFLDGIEAITPMPQGDVTIEEMKEALGDDIVLLDGIPAVLFNEEYPVSLLKNDTEKLINLFAGQIILGISDELPSNGLIERVEMVRDWVNEFNMRI